MYFMPEMSHRYLIVLFLVAISLLIIHKVMSSRFGMIITLIGRNPELAEAVGINTKKFIMLSYLIFTPFIGLGGVAYSHFIGFISPEAWNADLSLIIVFCSLIGGTANILGPMTGALIATGIPISFDITAEFRFGIVRILAILIFIFKPEGLISLIKELISFFIKKLKAKSIAKEPNFSEKQNR